MRYSLAFGALLASSQAPPVERKDLVGVINAFECKVADLVVTALHQYSSATPFCSSLLGIQTKTFTAISTTSTFMSTTIISQAPTSIITADAITVTRTEQVPDPSYFLSLLIFLELIRQRHLSLKPTGGAKIKSSPLRHRALSRLQLFPRA